jgi:hypothetical protein
MQALVPILPQGAQPNAANAPGRVSFGVYYIYIYIYIYIYSSFSTSLFFNFSPFSNNSTSPCSTIDTLRLIKNSSFSSVRTYIYIHPFKVYSFLVSFLFQSRWRMTLRALEMALSVGNILVSCSIM